MTQEEVEAIARAAARAVIEEQKRQRGNADEVSMKTISTILTSFGIDEEDRKEFRADLSFLRSLRTSSDQIQRVGIGTIVTILLGGVISVIWLGVKALLDR